MEQHKDLYSKMSIDKQQKEINKIITQIELLDQLVEKDKMAYHLSEKLVIEQTLKLLKSIDKFRLQMNNNLSQIIKKDNSPHDSSSIDEDYVRLLNKLSEKYESCLNNITAKLQPQIKDDHLKAILEDILEHKISDNVSDITVQSGISGFSYTSEPTEYNDL